jgi:RimJ/RimL family protein N-acetyltransferase
MGPVDELLDEAVERPALDQCKVDIGRALEDRVQSGLTGDHREERHLDPVDQTGGHQRPVHRRAAVRAQRRLGLLLEPGGAADGSGVRADAVPARSMASEPARRSARAARNPLHVGRIGCRDDRATDHGGEMTRPSLPTPTLHTARLRLRPFDDPDATDLFALHSSAYVLRYWDAPPWGERVRAERFITACRQMAEQGTGARLAVDRVCDGAFIGWCSLNRWNPDYRSASLGYCFDHAAWGRGYATEAARALLRWAFDTLDLNRVQAETDTRNVASARVLEKLGFRREGTLREDCIVNGEVSDSWVYGLIRREWRPSPEPVAGGHGAGGGAARARRGGRRT